MSGGTKRATCVKTCHFCGCRVRRGDSQRLAKSSPYAGPSAGAEIACLRKWHVWSLRRVLGIFATSRAAASRVAVRPRGPRGRSAPPPGRKHFPPPSDLEPNIFPVLFLKTAMGQNCFRSVSHAFLTMAMPPFSPRSEVLQSQRPSQPTFHDCPVVHGVYFLDPEVRRTDPSRTDVSTFVDVAL